MYVRRRDVGFVLLNTSKYLPRFRFTAAHEAAHHVLGHQVAVDQDVGQTGGDPQEQAANSFAAAFLVPEKALRERAEQTPKITPVWVFEVATEFGVSYDTLVYRLHNCGLLRGGYEQRDALRASRIGVVEEALDMPALPERTVFPRDYVRRAVAAYVRGDITLERLAELLEVDPQELARASDESVAGDGDETP